jgi:hypothetical protein
MSWMDLNSYLAIEEAAAARIDVLRDEAAAHAKSEIPASGRSARLGSLFKWDVARRIDDVIDYFGDTPRKNQWVSVSGCGLAVPCGARSFHDVVRPREH